jgi:hypothetical protein
MKSIFFLILIALFSSCTQKKINPKSVIVFEHTGSTMSILKTLVISLQKNNIPIHKDDSDEIRNMTRKAEITEQEKETYLNIKYTRIITDDLTLSSIVQFPNDNDKFSVNKINQVDRPGAQSYHVIYNGKTFQIYSKLKPQLFNDLKKFLIEKRCDTSVIQAISSL